MAVNDPTATQPVVSAESTQQITSTTAAISALNSVVSGLTGAIGSLTERFTGLKTSEKGAIDDTTALGDIMGIASLRVLGASQAFDGFKTQADQIGSFTGQIASMGQATQLTTGLLTKMAGAFGMGNAASATIDEIKKFVDATAKGADSALQLQQGYIGMQAATGGLGKMYQEAGGDLENLNGMLQKQSTLVMDTARATGTSAAQVMSYYQALGEAIPGSIDKQVNATSQAGTTMGNLQAVMALATGTGMSQKDVIKDLTTAWEDYGLEGDKALQFTQNMSDLSTHLGINLSYSQDFILKSADAFKKLADGGTNAGDVLNEMFQSFKDTGLSARQSTDMIEGITSSVSKLTIAQKAFLSAQTGGPGGLRGAFQIENMIRKGDIQGVINKEMEALKKQFGGKIYSQEEAGQSDFAASQFLKQRSLVQSGAFGGLAKDDATATRLLEAMKSGIGGTAMKDVTTTLKESVAKGTDVQERSYTELQRIANDIEDIRQREGIQTLDTLQKHFGGTVRTDRGTGELDRSSRDLHDTRRMGVAEAATGAAAMTGRHASEEKINVGEQRTASAKNLAADLAGMLPASFKPAIDKMLSGLSSTSKTGDDQAQAAYNQMMQSINAQQKKGVGPAFIEKDALASFGSKMDTLMGKNVFETGVQHRTGAGVVQQTIGAATPRDNRNASAVQQAIDVSKREANRPGAAPAGHEHAGAQAVPGKQQLEFTIKGINVVCDKCGNTMKPDAHTTVTTAGQTN